MIGPIVTIIVLVVVACFAGRRYWRASRQNWSVYLAIGVQTAGLTLMLWLALTPHRQLEEKTSSLVAMGAILTTLFGFGTMLLSLSQLQSHKEYNKGFWAAIIILLCIFGIAIAFASMV
jgi:ABC-type Na+ efflux pump permease subunit